MSAIISVSRSCRPVSAIWVIVAAFVLAHPIPGTCGEAKDQSSDPRTARDKRWDSLMRQAGKPIGPLVLEARLAGKSVVAGEAVRVTLSVKNVSGSVILFAFDFGDIPEVLVRDGNGVSVKLTEKGRKFFEGSWFPSMGVTNLRGVKIAPGGAFGEVFLLSEYFVLDRPGNYTVIATRRDWNEPSNSSSTKPFLVARPFSIEVKPPIMRATPADKQWNAYIANAGKPVEGCVLEAIDSPLSPGKADLVISLVCEELPEGYEGKPVRRAEMADYRVLVRDSLGRAVAPVAPTPAFPRTDRAELGKRFENDTSVYLHRGDAMGARIPLKKYFNLTKPGEYWALVSLPSATAGKPDWIAEPVRVRVDADPPAPKK